MAELSLTLSERHTADFEMIGNGGFAPLTGFQGSADWERVCSEMRTADGAHIWPIPITLATDLECEVGDTIAEGDTVVILESMKMEMPVEAEDEGTVKEIKCQEGQSVSEGDTLVVLE